MSSALVIVGAGGHGRELVLAAQADWKVAGFVDDGPVRADRLERLGLPLLGDTDWLAERGGACGIGVGDLAARRSLVERLAAGGCTFPAIVHPGAHVGPDVELAEGVVVYDRCTLTTNVRIGPHTHLNVGCVVQHDSRLGEFVQLSPGVYVNGDCVVEDGVFVGTGAAVTRGCRVGAGSIVGAGSVVLDDVPPGTKVVGTPARVIAHR